jgi:hypothetical protein
VCWCSVESASSGWTDVILLLSNFQPPISRDLANLRLVVCQRADESPIEPASDESNSPFDCFPPETLIGQIAARLLLLSQLPPGDRMKAAARRGKARLVMQGELAEDELF